MKCLQKLDVLCLNERFIRQFELIIFYLLTPLSIISSYYIYNDIKSTNDFIETIIIVYLTYVCTTKNVNNWAIFRLCLRTRKK